MGLIAVAILLLVVACDQGSSTSLAATPTLLVATPTSPPRIEVGPVGSGLFLPVLSLEYRGETIAGFMRSSCWDVDYQPGRECEDILRRYPVALYTEVARGELIIVQTNTDTRPKGLFLYVVTEPGEVNVDYQILWVANPTRFILDLPPGNYKVTLTGQWEEGNISVSYEFLLSLPGEPVLRAECEMSVIGGDLSLVLSSLDDPKRTAPDASNAGSCTYNKPIVQVRMILVNDSGLSYTETFHIDPPTSRVRFPLPDWHVSERAGGPLPPGEYSRRIVLTTADGDEAEVIGKNSSFFNDVVTLVKE